MSLIEIEYNHLINQAKTRGDYMLMVEEMKRSILVDNITVPCTGNMVFDFTNKEPIKNITNGRTKVERNITNNRTNDKVMYKDDDLVPNPGDYSDIRSLWFTYFINWLVKTIFNYAQV